MNRTPIPCAVLTACTLVALAAQAAPLQRADVINDPVWMVHVDADGLKSTVVGQYILAEMAKPEAQQKLAALQSIFGFDPRKDLHGLTLYGATQAQEDGVLLVYADFDAARLTTLAEGAKEHESVKHGQRTIHSWIDEKKEEKNGVKPRTYAAIAGKLVVFGQKESSVAAALDVLDRAKPSLLTNMQFAQFAPAPAFIQGAARKPELPGSDPSAAILKQSKMVTLTVNEAQRKLQAALALEADTEEIAGQIESIGRGLIGLLSLQKEKPEAQKIAQGLVVQKQGLVVKATLSLSADDAVELLKADAARKAAAKAEKE
jgi:hypothetical protein